MKCEGCGAVNPEGIRFCGYCGRPMAVPPAGPADTKSRNCIECGRAIGWVARGTVRHVPTTFKRNRF